MDRNPYTPPATPVKDPSGGTSFSTNVKQFESGPRRILWMLASLLMASAVAALVSALAWIRPPLSTSTLISTAQLVVGFGLIFSVLSLFIGFPLALLIERFRIGTPWVYTAVAAVTGALFAFSFGRRPTGELENPHGGVVFSPWTRDRPGIDEFPLSFNEYLSSIAFLAAVGAVLGFAFWYFNSRGPGSVIR